MVDVVVVYKVDTEAILEGRQPQTLMLKDMMRSIPLNWTDQRRMFGFSDA